MSAGSLALVAAAGLVAGAVNAIAGGGTLITFPALLAAGVPAIDANITSSVGLVTGYAGGAVAYRRELAGQGGRVRALGAVAVAGGVLGAVILLVTPAASFRAVVPYLILVSAALLAAQPKLAALVAARRADRAGSDSADPDGEITWGARLGVLVAAMYGSYFGAGLGVLLLGVLGVLLADHLQRLNALKGVLSLAINAVGVLIFVFSGRVHWPYAAVLTVTAYGGGVLGVALARRLRPLVLRVCVVALAVTVALALLFR